MSIFPDILTEMAVLLLAPYRDAAREAADRLLGRATLGAMG